MNKPIHAKPSLYAYYFLLLKEIALKYGYNLVLHGSLNRDMDLVAIPWEEVIGQHTDMIKEFAEVLGGEMLPNRYMKDGTETEDPFYVTHHGRMQYIININRGGYSKDWDKYMEDPQYYIDISVMPGIATEKVEFQVPDEDDLPTIQTPLHIP